MSDILRITVNNPGNRDVDLEIELNDSYLRKTIRAGKRATFRVPITCTAVGCGVLPVVIMLIGAVAAII